jgi:hypothetical protein
MSSWLRLLISCREIPGSSPGMTKTHVFFSFSVIPGLDPGISCQRRSRPANAVTCDTRTQETVYSHDRHNGHPASQTSKSIRFETPVNDPPSHKETKPLGQVRVRQEQASDYKEIEAS